MLDTVELFSSAYNLQSQMITILAGPLEDSFAVHRDVIEKHSAFFKAALSGGFQEGTEWTIRLPEHNSKIVSIYLNWAYSGKILLGSEVEKEPNHSLQSCCYTAAELYFLAHYVQNFKLQNEILDFMVNRPSASICNPIRHMVYSRFPKDCQFRRYFSDLMVYSMRVDTLAVFIQYVERELLEDLAVGWGMIKEGRKPRETPSEKVKAKRCYYHEHNEDFPPCQPQAGP